MAERIDLVMKKVEKRVVKAGPKAGEKLTDLDLDYLKKAAARNPGDDVLKASAKINVTTEELHDMLELEHSGAAMAPQEEKKEAQDLDAEHATAFRSGTGIMQWIAHATVRPRPDLQYTTKELAADLLRATGQDCARWRGTASVPATLR